MSQPVLDLLAFARQQFVAELDNLTVEQINTVPTGFNNNIIWNLAHVVAVQQAYLYGKNGLPSSVDATFITDYANGTFPKGNVTQQDIDTIKALAISTVTDLSNDIKNGVFANYQPSVITPNKITLETLDDAVAFILFHESMHASYARAIKRIVAGGNIAQTAKAA